MFRTRLSVSMSMLTMAVVVVLAVKSKRVEDLLLQFVDVVFQVLQSYLFQLVLHVVYFLKKTMETPLVFFPRLDQVFICIIAQELFFTGYFCFNRSFSCRDFLL